MDGNRFDFTKVDDFDKHIEMSIPNYEGLSKTFTGLVNYHSRENSTVIDIGCSTGKFLYGINKREDMEIIGFDEVDILQYDIDFDMGDACDLLREAINPRNDNSIVISMFTLQFLNCHKRKEVLDSMKSIIADGGKVLIAEKIYLDDPELQTQMFCMHLEEKREHFTDTEILDKDALLTNSMHCVTEARLIEELCSIGTPTRVWQSYNFVGYIVG